MTWAWMFHTDFGIINYALKSLGLIDEPIGWLTNPRTVLPALIAVNVWKMFPFVAVMVLAGLQTSRRRSTRRRGSTAPISGRRSATSRCRSCARCWSSSRCCCSSGA